MDDKVRTAATRDMPWDGRFTDLPEDPVSYLMWAVEASDRGKKRASSSFVRLGASFRLNKITYCHSILR